MATINVISTDSEVGLSRGLRAVIVVMTREINILRVASGLPARTKAQVIKAIRDELKLNP